jgi:peptidoglycan/LPS O-acetylase OafA/YrhL
MQKPHSSVRAGTRAGARVEGVEGLRVRLPHLPALDGLRGVAVVAVLLFHGGFGWAGGGFLGVTTFFVLSGFLITSLLLVERDRTGRVDVATFFARRARRLVPATLVLAGLVVAYMLFGSGHPPSGVFGDAVASATWVANWRFVLMHRSYADVFTDPSPFQHMWSLAVEEQFYVVLALAAFLLLHRRRAFAGVVVTAVAASTAAAVHLHAASAFERAYYGTDARAAEPLVGVLLALLLVRRGGRGLRQFSRVGRRVLDVAASLSFVVLLGSMAMVSERSTVLYHGGFLLVAVLAAVVIAAATQPGSLVVRALSLTPLMVLGRISYGVYLFHWPIFLWVSERSTNLAGISLFATRMAITFVISVASFAFIEQPVRRGRFAVRVAAVGWANASIGLLAALLAVVPSSATLSTSVFASGSEAPVVPAPPPPPSMPSTTNSQPPGAAAPSAVANSPRREVRRPSAPSQAAVPGPTSGRTGRPSVAVLAPTDMHASPPPPPTSTPGPSDGEPEVLDPGKPPPLKVAIVGDSMAEGLGNGLAAWAKNRDDVVTYNLSIGACPMSRGGTRRVNEDDDFPIADECGWWSDPDDDRSKYLAEFDPDVVVMQDGMNEVPDRKLPSWVDYRHPGQPLFDSWLADEYSSAIRTLAAHGAVVLALNAACVDWSRNWTGFGDNGEGDRRVVALNQVARTLVNRGAQVGDLNAHLCPNGKFTDSVDGVENARPDGYHLSKGAVEVVAERWLGPLVLDVGRPSPS